MKYGKYPNKTQTELIESIRDRGGHLVAKYWRVYKETDEEIYIYSKDSGMPYYRNPIKKVTPCSEK